MVDEKEKEIFFQKIAEILTPYKERLQENTHRVLSLLHLYKTATDLHSHPATADILRACVVFTHATLEDFLRSLASELLPKAEEEALSKIRLAGSQKDKFHLGQLARFRGKSIDDVLTESVQEHLGQSSYNNITQIVVLLDDIGIKVSEVNGEFTALASLMQRRHQIVHRADRSVEDDRVCPISASDVLIWVNSVHSFIDVLVMKSSNLLLIAKGYVKQDGDMFEILPE